jgi:hypothetical protein
VSVTYHPRVRRTKFYVLSFPAIWWPSVKLQCGSVTQNDSVTVYIRWAYCLQSANSWSIWRKSHNIKPHTIILSFLWRRTLQQRLRTQRNLKASCATTWWSLLLLLLLLLLLYFSWYLSTGGMKLTGEARNTRGNPIPVPLCPPQIPRRLTRDRTRASALGGRQLTSWAMARP